jgi:hypothetical protein
MSLEARAYPENIDENELRKKVSETLKDRHGVPPEIRLLLVFGSLGRRKANLERI